MDKFRLVKRDNHVDNSTLYYFEQKFTFWFFRKKSFWFHIRVGGFYFFKDYGLAINILNHLQNGTLIEENIIIK